MASKLPPVTPERIAIAAKTLEHADIIAVAARDADVSYHLACALIDGESNGANVFGGDGGPRHEVYAHGPGEQPIPVTAGRYHRFIFNVLHGATSNGVGPMQITYAGSLKNGCRDGGYFKQMADLELKPWDVYDNVFFGLNNIWKPTFLGSGRDVALAGSHYNGGTNPNSSARAYGRALKARDDEWKQKFGL